MTLVMRGYSPGRAVGRGSSSLRYGGGSYPVTGRADTERVYMEAGGGEAGVRAVERLTKQEGYSSVYAERARESAELESRAETVVEAKTGEELRRLEEKYPGEQVNVEHVEAKVRKYVEKARKEDRKVRSIPVEERQEFMAKTHRVTEIVTGGKRTESRRELEFLKGSLPEPIVEKEVTRYRKQELAEKYASMPLRVEGKKYYGGAAAAKALQLEAAGREVPEPKPYVMDYGGTKLYLTEKTKELFFDKKALEQRSRQAAQIRAHPSSAPYFVPTPQPRTMLPPDPFFGIKKQTLLMGKSPYQQAGLEFVPMPLTKSGYTLEPKGWPATVGEAGFREWTPIMGPLVSARYHEVRAIEREYRIKLAKGVKKKEADAWKQQQLKITEERIGGVYREGVKVGGERVYGERVSAQGYVDRMLSKGLHYSQIVTPWGASYELGHNVMKMMGYKTPSLKQMSKRTIDMDLPYIDIELGHRGRVAATGVTLAASGIGGAMVAPGAMGPISGVMEAGLYGASATAGYMSIQPTAEYVSKKTGSKFLGFATGLGVGMGIASIPVKMSSTVGRYVGFQRVKLPDQNWMGVIIKGKPVIAVGRKGLIPKVSLGTKGVKPLHLEPGKAVGVIPSKHVLPEYSMVTQTPQAGLAKTAILTAAIKKQPAFPKPEVTRFRTGYGIGQLLEPQAPPVVNPLDFGIVRNFNLLSKKGQKAFKDVLKKYDDELTFVYKGSFPAAMQTAPEFMDVLRTPKDVDIGTIGDPTPLRKEIVEAVGKHDPVYEKGISVKIRQPGKDVTLSDVIRREEIVGDEGKAIEEMGEYYFGLSTRQKPLKAPGGGYIQSLSEQMVRKMGTVITVRRSKAGEYFLNPVNPGRIYKDIYDFQETIVPSLIKSAKSSPKTYLRGRKAEKLLKEFKATRGKDIMTPLPKQAGKLGMIITPSKIPFKPLKISKAKPSPLKPKPSKPSKPSKPVEYEEYRFYYMTPKAYKRLYGKPKKQPYKSIRPIRYPKSPFSFIPRHYIPYATKEYAPVGKPKPYKPDYYYPKHRIQYDKIIYDALYKTPDYIPAYKTIYPGYGQKYYTPTYYQPQYQPTSYYTPTYKPPKTTQSTFKQMSTVSDIPKAVKKKKAAVGKPPLWLPRDQSQQGFDVFVKRKQLKKGKGSYESRGYVKANRQPLTRKGALVLGGETVDRYTNRSFKIKRSKKGVKPRAGEQQAYALRWDNMKQKLRPKKGNKNIYVEKTGYAIDSLEEKLGIPYESVRQRKRRRRLF